MRKTSTMKWFEFGQNNSGGTWDVSDKLCHRVFIEAESPTAATDIAEELGIYFDGCTKGLDCDCCGDRWSPLWSNDGKTFPFAYSTFDKETAEKFAKKYGVEVRESEKPGHQKNNPMVVFPDIESYAQFLADEYGWTEPDGRLFFADGKVKEIFVNVSEKD